MNIIVVGDCHATPHYSNDRFDVLGAHIAETRPDVVVQIGDMGDFSSVSAHDRGRRGWDREDLEADFEATADACERLMLPSKKSRRKSPTKFVLTEGNHEDRVSRFVSENAPLHRLLQKRYDKAMHMFDVTVPFKQLHIEGGVGFWHFLPTRMGTATAGVNLARSVLLKARMSCVVGHSHILDYAEDVRADGRKMFGLSAGCMVHPEHDEKWSRGTDGCWWRGIVELDGVSDGYYREMRFRSLESMA
jgi:hypothetical protein